MKEERREIKVSRREEEKRSDKESVSKTNNSHSKDRDITKRITIDKRTPSVKGEEN